MAELRVPQWQRRELAAACALLLLVCVALYCTRRMQTTIAEQMHTVAVLAGKQTVLDDYLRHHGDLSKAATQLHTETTFLNLSCPATLDTRQTNAALYAAAGKSKLHITKLTWDKGKAAKAKTSALAALRHEVSVVAEGSYFAWYDFLNRVEHGRKFADSGALRLRTIADGVTGTVIITVFSAAMSKTKGE